MPPGSKRGRVASDAGAVWRTERASWAKMVRRARCNRGAVQHKLRRWAPGASPIVRRTPTSGIPRHQTWRAGPRRLPRDAHRAASESIAGDTIRPPRAGRAIGEAGRDARRGSSAARAPPNRRGKRKHESSATRKQDSARWRSDTREQRCGSIAPCARKTCGAVGRDRHDDATNAPPECRGGHRRYRPAHPPTAEAARPTEGCQQDFSFSTLACFKQNFLKCRRASEARGDAAPSWRWRFPAVA